MSDDGLDESGAELARVIAAGSDSDPDEFIAAVEALLADADDAADVTRLLEERYGPFEDREEG